jgi:hypothetical protein
MEKPVEFDVAYRPRPNRGSKVYGPESVFHNSEASRAKWTALRSDVLTAQRFCGQSVATRYVVDRMGPNVTTGYSDMIMVMYDMAPGFEWTPIGFVLAQFKDDAGHEFQDGVYLDVICGRPGYGNKLMNEFIGLFRTKSFIKLNAMPTVLGFYQGWSFQFRHSCAEDPVKIPSDDLKNYLAVVMPNKATGEAPKVRSEHEAYADKNAMKIIELLVRANLQVTRKYDSKKCKASDIKSRKDIVDNECANDGFEMYRCAAEPLTGRYEDSLPNVKDVWPLMAKKFLYTARTRRTVRTMVRPSSRSRSRSPKRPRPTARASSRERTRPTSRPTSSRRR